MRTFAAVAVAALGILLPAPAALADQGTVTQYRPTTSVQFRHGDGDKLVVETTLDLAAGERRHLRGRLEVVSSFESIVALNAVLKCFSTGSTPALVGTASTSSRNHEGSDAAYPDGKGHLTLAVDLLFAAPQAGAYRCGLYAKTSAGANTGTYNLAVVTGGKSWLEISDTHQAGAQWWENPECSSTGSSPTCTYIGKGQPDSAWIFYQDGTSVIKWPHAAGATQVEAIANVTATTCYVASGSCDRVAAADREPRRPGSGSVVDFRLDVIQLDRAGSKACVTTSAARTSVITDDAHHFTTRLTIPKVLVDSSCGGLFLLRVYAKHVSGSPVKIDGRQGGTSLTNGILLNRWERAAAEPGRLPATVRLGQG
jgi:hypothetical protein